MEARVASMSSMAPRTMSKDCERGLGNLMKIQNLENAIAYCWLCGVFHTASLGGKLNLTCICVSHLCLQKQWRSFLYVCDYAVKQYKSISGARFAHLKWSAYVRQDALNMSKSAAMGARRGRKICYCIVLFKESVVGGHKFGHELSK